MLKITNFGLAFVFSAIRLSIFLRHLTLLSLPSPILSPIFAFVGETGVFLFILGDYSTIRVLASILIMLASSKPSIAPSSEYRFDLASIVAVFLVFQSAPMLGPLVATI
jgi:hypothetical protein